MASLQGEASSFKWFRRWYEPGTIITLKHPGLSRWKILEKLHEHDRQLPESEVHNKDYSKEPPSYASILLLCRNADDRAKEAFMRIYAQVPWTNSEMDDPQTRGEQAMKKFEPQELIAYQALLKAGAPNAPKLLGWKTSHQDRSGLVPGGFTVTLAWEKVPGLRLGDHTGAHTFWTLPDKEKDLIRKAVIDGLRNLIVTTGCAPCVLDAGCLVWNRKEQKIYFVGYRDSEVYKGGKVDIDARRLRWFGLDKKPEERGALLW